MQRGFGRISVCVLLLAVACAACSSSGDKARTVPSTSSSTTSSTSTTTRPSTTTSTSTSTTTTTAPAASSPIVTEPRGRVPIPSGPVVAAQPFSSSVSTVTAADLGASYHAGCPVGADHLRRIRLSYWGFDGQSHRGTLVVNVDAVDAITATFRQLYDERFPIRQMVTVDVYGGDDHASMAADNTSAFNCRFVNGTTRWSEHASGHAIDVNTIENPYVQGSFVSPPAGTAYMDRGNVRPGMAYWGGALVDAFAAVGWQWGGRWADPDYQHFSSTGG